jgi:DNA-binding CsgD family transcriptional regulator
MVTQGRVLANKPKVKKPNAASIKLGKSSSIFCPHCGASVLRLKEGGEIPDFTDRQMQILRMTLDGKDAKEIGEEFQISPRTVEFHRGIILRKVNLRSQSELMVWALANRVIGSSVAPAKPKIEPISMVVTKRGMFCQHCGAVIAQKAEPDTRKPEPELTERQEEILRLVIAGMEAKQIGEALKISSRTVEFHRNTMMEKLGLHSIQALTVWSAARRIVTYAL